MAVSYARGFSFLVVVSLSMMLVILSWESVSKNVLSWTNPLSRRSGEDKWPESGSAWWNKENATPAVASSAVTTPVTKLQTRRPTSSTRDAETAMPVLDKQSFKKLPEWPFEDVYKLDPPRPTTCAESLRNVKDAAFEKAFLPNIRLFLHKNDISMREWNRLSHFNNPFGFMGFQHDEVMAAVKLIPDPMEPLLHPKAGSGGCVRCAVVGNGGILNGSRMGAEIDAHDYVFRMNGAAIKGYEEDVGERTSVYVHTAHSITASPAFFRKYGYVVAPHDQGIKYVMIPEGMRDYQWLQGLLKGEKVATGSYRNREPRTYYSGQFNETRFYVLHQDFMRYVRNRFLKSNNLNRRYWAIVRPTNGAFTLFLALHTCDTVDAYGFMTDDYAKYSNYYLERNIKTRVIFYANHDYHLEKNVWKDLHSRGILRLYQRTLPEGGTTTAKKP